MVDTYDGKKRGFHQRRWVQRNEKGGGADSVSEREKKCVEKKTFTQCGPDEHFVP